MKAVVAAAPELRGSYDAVYLSPHLDDVVLSCGGRIHDLRAAGKSVLVVTVGCGEPPGEPPPLAAKLHRAWGMEGAPSATVVAHRRAEDLAACAVLGADALHWDLPEAVYRLHPATGEPFYRTLADLFAPLSPADRPSVLRVAERLADLPAHRELHVPLAVGGHVDHYVTRRAAEQRFGSNLVYYEELPYGRRRRDVRRLTRTVGWRGEAVPVSAEGLKAKVRAVGEYRSQIRALFGGPRRMRWQVRRDMRRLGGERVWWWETA